MKNEIVNKKYIELQKELEELRFQLNEANDTIEAIRTGQVDALVVQSEDGHQLYTLKSADQTYRVFIEKMTEGAITLNLKGQILYCNTQFSLMVQDPLSSIIGSSFEQFISPNDIARYKQLFESSWKEDCKGEIQIISGESLKPVQLSLTTLDLEEGKSLSIILTDLTRQKKTEHQLRESNQQLEEINRALEISNHDLQQFASIASHDLQEPLRKIQIFSNLMKERQGNLLPESLMFLQKIIDSSARMKTLIIDILNYSKLSARELNIEPIALNEILAELIDDFELIIQEKKASIIIENLPIINANKGQIRQVFQNLISNALKFVRSDVNPSINISSKRINSKSFNAQEEIDGGFYLLIIKDNGIGFDEKYVQNIFSLFERLNSKDKFEGTGIGLAIAKKIIEKHHGLITAISKEGEGSEFKIILPISQN